MRWGFIGQRSPKKAAFHSWLRTGVFVGTTRVFVGRGVYALIQLEVPHNLTEEQPCIACEMTSFTSVHSSHGLQNSILVTLQSLSVMCNPKTRNVDDLAPSRPCLVQGSTLMRSKLGRIFWATIFAKTVSQKHMSVNFGFGGGQACSLGPATFQERVSSPLN